MTKRSDLPEVLYVTEKCPGALSTLKGKTIKALDKLEPGMLADDRVVQFYERGWLAPVEEVVESNAPAEAPPPKKRMPGRGRRSFTAEDLAEKTLEELNVMVLELDPKTEAFETSEEAIAWLGADLRV